MTEEITRDRPYIRHVYLRVEDMDRFKDFARTTPRKDFIQKITNFNNLFVLVTLRIKKQELLYLQLAFKVVVKKHRNKKRSIVSITGTRKTI